MRLNSIADLEALRAEALEEKGEGQGSHPCLCRDRMSRQRIGRSRPGVYRRAREAENRHGSPDACQDNRMSRLLRARPDRHIRAVGNPLSAGSAQACAGDCRKNGHRRRNCKETYISRYKSQEECHAVQRDSLLRSSNPNCPQEYRPDRSTLARRLSRARRFQGSCKSSHDENPPT